MAHRQLLILQPEKQLRLTIIVQRRGRLALSYMNQGNSNEISQASHTSFTLSIGAVAVFATAPAQAPATASCQLTPAIEVLLHCDVTEDTTTFELAQVKLCTDCTVCSAAFTLNIDVPNAPKKEHPVMAKKTSWF